MSKIERPCNNGRSRTYRDNSLCPLSYQTRQTCHECPEKSRWAVIKYGAEISMNQAKTRSLLSRKREPFNCAITLCYKCVECRYLLLNTCQCGNHSQLPLGEERNISGGSNFQKPGCRGEADGGFDPPGSAGIKRFSVARCRVCRLEEYCLPQF